MSSIDERVVGMKFDNAQFEQGIKTTLASLDALNQKLKLEGATKGLSDISAAAGHMQLGHIAQAVDDIASHFKAMSIIAITALANIATRAVDTGLSVIKSLTVGPISAGLQEYQTNINSIQTILSNTRWQHTGLDDVNKALDILNHYADQTIYNFTQMARNIGTFTAAGVKLDVATNAIKGIANLAAVSGSNAEQASMAMYQLSQALATGTVKLIDWNSVVNAGMGGKVFQDALMETARVHGVAIDKMLKDAGSFRATLEKGWLSASILTETLQHFTGDLTQQQLISQGYTLEQAKAIVAMGKDAQDAATKVKTISQLLSTLQEAAGSGWTKTWQLIFGDFEEARTFFTDVNNVLGQFIQNSADARNNVLQDWKDLGGRTVLIEAVSNAFHALLDILRPIRDAFRDMFPKTTGAELYNITVAIRDFTEFIQISADTADKLHRTFAGVFAVLGIGYDILKQVGKLFLDLFTSFGDGGTGILDITANIGDFLVFVRVAIQEGGYLQTFFEGLYNVLHKVIEVFKQVTKAVASLFDGFDPVAAGQGVASFIFQLGPLGKLANLIVVAWSAVLHLFDNLWKTFGPLAMQLAQWFHEVSVAIGGLNFESLLHAINTGLFASLIVILKRAIGRNGISGLINQLTGTLQTMQNTLRAATILEIAAAIGILTISVSALSKIDPVAMAKALTGMAAMFTELMAAMFVLERMPGGGIFRIYATATALSLLAVAIDLLTVSVVVLSKLDAKGLHRGLISTALLIGSVVAAVRLMPPDAKIFTTSLGIIAIAAGIKILASAVKDLASLSWEQIAKGISATAALLGALALFTKLVAVDSGGVFQGLGIILLATGIKILASALLDMGKMDWIQIAKGITTLAGALVAIGSALLIIPPSSVLSAAGVLIVATSLGMIGDALQKMGNFDWIVIAKGLVAMAGALTLISAALAILSDAAPTAPLSAVAILAVSIALGYIADAINKMGGMSWTEIAKGLIVLAGSLGIITAALVLLPSALPGAFALVVVAGALTVLAGVMKVLGTMAWGEIIKGLVTLAGAFAVLGIASALLAPVIPAMLGLGAAVLLIGAGLAAAGAGVFLFAAGLTALSVAGAAGAAAIVAIVSAVIGLVPAIVEQVGVALLMIIDILIEATPKIVKLVLDILVQVLDGIIKLAPKIEQAFVALVNMFLDVLIKTNPKMVTTGLALLTNLLKGIRDHIDEIVPLAQQIMIKFINKVADGLPDIIQAGVNLILKFMDGVTKAIDNNSDKLGAAGAKMALAIVRGMINGLRSADNEVAKAAINVAKSAWNAAMDFLGIHSPSLKFMQIGKYVSLGLAQGISNYSYAARKEAETMAVKAVDTVKNTLADMAKVIQTSVDPNPVITPVMDLSTLKRSAAQMDALFGSKPINVNQTYTSARRTSDDIQNTRTLLEMANVVQTGNNYNYTQYNTSPKALSTADIYRQTKNQLSTAREGLPT